LMISPTASISDRSTKNELERDPRYSEARFNRSP
jgi:hypothetical protein